MESCMQRMHFLFYPLMMQVKPLRFIHRNAVVERQNVPPTRTLLQLIREDLGLTGTKEGCNEGDCGACTVVLAEPDGHGGLATKAVNSCIKMAHSIDGMALWTCEDIASPDRLHPAQQAMVDCHASQCGFCTPGFVMSLFGMYENQVRCGQAITRASAQSDLSGNLCRCTGYRPILDAAQRMAEYPEAFIDRQKTLQKCELLRQYRKGLEANLKEKSDPSAKTQKIQQTYLQPYSLDQLLDLRADYPQAQLVAGCTDVGLWVNKQHQQFTQVLDIMRVQELRQVERYPHHIAIGAAVNLHDAYAAMVQDRPQLQDFALRFAGLPVRNAGTLGGNVANGSPIGDSMPLLIALRANVVLMSRHGCRELELEKLYTGYRQNVIRNDEVLAWIKIPLPTAQEFLRVYKISKRFDDDISAVCLAIRLLRDGQQIRQLSIGVGGIAATPIRAIKTEAAQVDSIWSRINFEKLKNTLMEEFNPLSDMRASSDYRRQMLGGLMERFWLESTGCSVIRLENLGSSQQILQTDKNGGVQP